MDALEALVLGIIQGLTEWLPVSSSGHLVLAQEFFGLASGQNLLFDLVVHMGTVLAVCVYFRKELWRILRALFTPKRSRGPQEDALRTLGLMVLVGTVPVAIIGVLLTNAMEDVFTVGMVGAALIVNAGVLLSAWRFAGKGERRNVRLSDAVVISLFQAVAIIPGISRSGSTICGGMFRGLDREMAATFAFLLSVPALLGAFAYGFATLDSYDADPTMLLLGMTAAFVAGVVSIDYLLRVVRSGRLWMFAVYCAALGAVVLALTL